MHGTKLPRPFFCVCVGGTGLVFHVYAWLSFECELLSTVYALWWLEASECVAVVVCFLCTRGTL